MSKISGHFAKELNVDLLSSKYGLILISQIPTVNQHFCCNPKIFYSDYSQSITGLIFLLFVQYSNFEYSHDSPTYSVEADTRSAQPQTENGGMKPNTKYPKLGRQPSYLLLPLPDQPRIRS